MDGENNGSNPMNKWMIWGVKAPIFGGPHPPVNWRLSYSRVVSFQLELLNSDGGLEFSENTGTIGGLFVAL